jgi:hypothetical protein
MIYKKCIEQVSALEDFNKTTYLEFGTPILLQLYERHVTVRHIVHAALVSLMDLGGIGPQHLVDLVADLVVQLEEPDQVQDWVDGVQVDRAALEDAAILALGLVSGD